MYINDYIARTISENPDNNTVIVVDFFLKGFHNNSNVEVRLLIWNITENEKFWNISRMYCRNSKGGIVFWSVKNRSMESARFSNRTVPDIPIILLVDTVFKTPEKWIGEGLGMNSSEEMGTFCSEHEFVAWFDMLERGAGEMCVFGQAVATLVNKINCGNTTIAQSCV